MLTSLLHLILYRIDPTKFAVGNRFDTCCDFINAVIKVQQGKEETLTPKEAETIAKWKISTPEPDVLDAGPQASGLSDFDRLNLERGSRRTK